MPNLRELSRLIGTSVDGEVWLANSAAVLTRSLELTALLVTRGSAGMTLLKPRRADAPRGYPYNGTKSLRRDLGPETPLYLLLPQALQQGLVENRRPTWQTLPPESWLVSTALP